MKKKILILVSILVVFLAIPPFVNYWVSTPSPIGFIPIEKQEVWISFYASLIGSGITLLGVALTICYTDFTMMVGYQESFQNTINKTKILNDTAVEYINGIEVIKAFGKAQSSYEKFEVAAKEGADCYVEWMRRCNVPFCIAIHTYAGVELRLKMHEIMTKQGHEEETGKAKITSGYNLPAKYILHTVGPIIQWKVTKKDEELLASCYRECLRLAADTGTESIAFCCLSTGVFRFPQQRAAEIATNTVKQYLDKDSRIKKVIFNVFKDEDLKIYNGLL